LIELDGSAVDMATIIVGFFPPLVRLIGRIKTGRKPCFIREKAIIDMLNGVMLVPFVLMIGSVFFSQLMQELMSSAKITVAIGGLAGLFFVIGELFKDDD